MNRYLQLFLTIFFVFSTNGLYNDIFAKKMSDMCRISYCPEDSVMNWTCSPCEIWPDTKLISVFSYPKYSVFGFSALIKEGIVFSFEGTQDIEDFIIDLQISRLIPYKDHPTAEVHEGFWKAYTSVREDIIDIARKNLQLDFYCTGHSLGAAMATLLSLDLQETLGKNCTMYNLGSPRVGNKEYGKLFDQSSRTFRITHWNDPVPRLPPMALGFYHIHEEFWYNQEWTSYVFCPTAESLSCADSRLFPTSIHDHRFYFNTSISQCDLNT